jgi:hypothetical protein
MSERVGKAYWALVDAVENFRKSVNEEEFLSVVSGLSMLKRDMRFIKALAVSMGVDTERRESGISKGSEDKD